MLKKIYSCQHERTKTFKHLGLPEDICWIIEAKICLSGEFNKSFVKHMSRMGRNSYFKKRRAKKNKGLPLLYTVDM